MASLHVIQKHNRRIIRRQRKFNERLILNQLEEEELLSAYRLKRHMIREIVVGYAETVLANKTERSHAICNETQVCRPICIVHCAYFLTFVKCITYIYLNS